MDKVCVLHSGGIDSTGVLLWYLSRNVDIQAIYINYGQAAATTEWEHCKKVAKRLNTAAPVRINASIRELSAPHSLMIGKKRKENRQGDVIDKFIDEFFPNRNLYLLTLASIYCYQNHINTIALGILDGCDFGYTDTSPEFLRKADALLKQTVNIDVKAPFIKWSKPEVVQYLLKKGIDIDITYSCNVQAAKACGECASCIERKISLTLPS